MAQETTDMTTASAAVPVVQGLKTLLADTYALMAQTHIAHWNVEGPYFFQLHTAFQTQYEELFEAVDEIAERLRALEVIAPGGLKMLAEASEVEEIAADHLPARDFVAHLIEGHELLLNHAAALRDACDEAGDLETQDMVIGRIQVHEKTVWMLKSFLKNL